MAIQGNIQHAVILVNKLRTKEFYAAKPGEIIWRAELWHFERPEETWLKVQDEMFIVMYRERIQRNVDWLIDSRVFSFLFIAGCLLSIPLILVMTIVMPVLAQR